METEGEVEDKAEAATARVKTNITILRIHNKINVIKVASNNMAITNKWAPKVPTPGQKVVTKVNSTTSSSNSNRISFSYPKLTFHNWKNSKAKRERTSSETVFSPPSNQCLEIQLPESSPVCSWTRPLLTPRSFCRTTHSSSARSTRLMRST